MAVQSSSPAVVHSRSVEPSSPRAAFVVDSAFEERWEAWRARALRHDMAVPRRMRSVLASLRAIQTMRGYRLRIDGAHKNTVIAES